MPARFTCMAVALFVAAFILSAKTPDEFGKRVAVGITSGTDGFGLTAGTAYGDHIGFRTGLTFLPQFLGTTVSVTVKCPIPGMPDESHPFRVEPNSSFYHVFLDVYPSSRSDFRLTVGMFGSEGEQAVRMMSSDRFPSVGGFTPLCFEADLPMILPYAGIGAGRLVRKGGRLQVGFDIGVAWKGHGRIRASNAPGSSGGILLDTDDLRELDSRMKDPLCKVTGKGLLLWFSETRLLPVFRLNVTWRIL